MFHGYVELGNRLDIHDWSVRWFSRSRRIVQGYGVEEDQPRPANTPYGGAADGNNSRALVNWYQEKLLVHETQAITSITIRVWRFCVLKTLTRMYLILQREMDAIDRFRFFGSEVRRSVFRLRRAKRVNM